MGIPISITDNFIYSAIPERKSRELEEGVEEGFHDGIHYLYVKGESIERSESVVMVSHANCKNAYYRIEMIKYLREIFGCDVYIYDYPGFGRSEGSISTSDCIYSAVKIYDYLSTCYSAIILWGESIGGGVNAELYKLLTFCGSKLPKLLIHHHSFYDLRRVAKDKALPFLPLSLLKSTRAFPQYPVAKIYKEYLFSPLVIIYSEGDKFIKPQQSLDLYKELKEADKEVYLRRNEGKHRSYRINEETIQLLRSF